MKYLVLYNDGCNGLRRSGVALSLPQGAFERNPGDGVWELGEGSYAVELRDKDPIITAECDEDEEWEEEDLEE